MDKQIANLYRQNDGIELSFQKNGIVFTKLSISIEDKETELMLLTNYNNYLKDIAKKNRPPPQEKPKTEVEEEEEDCPKEEAKPVYSTITNMEDIKRAFFNQEYDTFTTLVRQHPFHYYKANYKYASDNTGRPEYVAKNLLRGFAQHLDDYRRYLLVCFRCLLVKDDDETKEYKYPSYWIVNSNDDLKTILGDLSDDFNFIRVDKEEAIVRLLKKMERKMDVEDAALVGEIYVH